jgi:hypothetical protein
VAAPVYSNGQILNASDCDLWFTPIAAYKTATTARTSATLVTDPDLQITLAASSVYEVTAGHNWLAATGVGISWAFTIPSGATGAYQVSYSLAGTFGLTWTSTVTAGSAGAPNYGAVIRGLITTTSSGTFALQWGSGTGGSSCTMGVGGLLVARRVG